MGLEVGANRVVKMKEEVQGFVGHQSVWVYPKEGPGGYVVVNSGLIVSRWKEY